MSNKTARTNIILSIIALITSITIVCGAVLAWFAMTTTAKTDAVRLSVIDRHDDGFRISFEDGSLIDEDLFIFPESYVDIKLTALRDCSFIKLRLTHDPLTKDEFDEDYKSFFLSRPDLLIAGYEEKQAFTDKDGKDVYREFDMEKAAADNNERLEFLREFSTQNSIVSAISAMVTDKDGVEVNNVIFEAFEPDVLIGVDYTVLKGETVTLRIEYGLNGFQPAIKDYSLGEKAANDYRALNYNCFIGQLFSIEIFGVLD